MVTLAIAPSSIEVRDVAGQRYLGKRVSAPVSDVGSVVRATFAELYATLAANNVTPTGMPFLTASRPDGGEMRIQVGVPCDAPPAGAELFAGRLPAGRVAVATFRGRYEEIGPVYAELAAWIRDNGHIVSGPPREAYLTGPQDVTHPDDHVTEVIWPIV